MSGPVALTMEVLKDRIAEAQRTHKLNIGYMGLTSIDPEMIQTIAAAAPHITILEISSNNLTDLPEEIALLRYVRKFYMKYNKLTRVPAVLTKFPQLQVLELSGNQIDELDDSVAALKHVAEFDLSGNQLRKLPDAICKMPSLTLLQLENNRLETLPESMDELKTLVRLDVSTNHLTYLPVSMGKLKRIQRIDAANNQLAKVPPCMGHCKTLKEFNLKYNDLVEHYRVKSEEGLVRFLAFLREEEERERLEEIERLKPVGTEVGAYTEYRCKAEVSQVIKLDDGESIAIDNRCWIRTGHSLTQVGNHVYMFGGVISKDGTKTNELFWLTTDRMEWHNQLTTGVKPCPRDGHCAVYDEHKNMLVVFGGRSPEKKRLNDVCCLKLDTWEWIRPTCDGAAPAPREQGMSFVLEGMLYVFGGHGSGQRFNDLHVLDLGIWNWSTPTTSGTPPSPRQSSAVYLHGGLMYLHGGRNNAVLDDLFVFDMNERKWTEIITDQTRAPPARHGHIITVFGNDVLLFGGQGTLGGQATNLYKLPIPDRASLTTARPEWLEMDSEMPYNKCRTYTFHANQLSCLQLGSSALGITVSEDADRGLAFWDVFRHCELGGLQEKALDEDALKPKNPKLERIKHTMVNLGSSMPRTYVAHSAKEKRIIDYTDDFQRTFREIYPQRRPLILLPENECGVRKFVCTTIRPTMLMFSEMYDLRSCSRFVADFVGYEQLENPLHYPSHLPSPMSILNWQAGDCFDMSIVLCSLLIGVGYDAYVVVGYAPKSVTTNDQSKTTCPVLEAEAAAAEEEAKRAKENVVEEKPSKYTVRQAVVLESQFVKTLEEEIRTKQLEAAETQRKLEEEEMQAINAGLSSSDEPEDNMVGKRVHSWVLVLAGKREVGQSIFVEPSTGRFYPTGSSPYLGIEQMWNHVNTWVNMQIPEPHSDARSVIGSMSFDLQDAAKWEYVLEGADKGPFTGEKSKEEAELTADTIKANTDKPRQSTIGAGKFIRKETLQGHEEGEPGAAGDGADGEAQASGVVGLSDDMPPSWVPKLHIPRDKMDMRCPKGIKSTLYHRCQHELFALFGECGRWDGMVEKLTVYGDDDRTEVLECRETYARRKDKLRERRTYPVAEITQEFFDPGSSYGLKDITVTKGTSREVNFFHKSRLDGLSKRVEDIRKKTMEYFIGRDDRLEYRSVTYLPMPEPKEDQQEQERRPGRRRKKNEEPLQPIRKMTTKYARDEKADAETDVFKKTFYLAEERIRIIYHYHPSRITRSQRIYTNDNAHALRHITQVDPLAIRPNDGQLLEEYQRLVAEERECVQAIRDSEREWKATMTVRTKEEQNITLITPYYDIVRAKTEESDEEEAEEVKAHYDFLQPFMPVIIGTRNLTREEALEVREKCLKALKDRLIERANIIQARHEEETSALAKRQANFQRDRDQMSREDEEEYERQCEESMFRIHILEQRLKRHEEQALQKYYELDSKLRSDERLAILTSGE